MRRAVKRKKPKALFVILATSIAMLNFMGISYAAWNDELQIVSHVSTGNMDVEFAEASIEIIGDGYIEESVIDINGKRMNVFGTVVIEHDAEVPEILLNYTIRNTGTTPVQYTSNGGSAGIYSFYNSSPSVLNPSEGSSTSTVNLSEGNGSTGLVIIQN